MISLISVICIQTPVAKRLIVSFHNASHIYALGSCFLGFQSSLWLANATLLFGVISLAHGGSVGKPGNINTIDKWSKKLNKTCIILLLIA